MDTGGGIWSLLTIIGPLVLIAALAWAILNNRRKPRDKARTEQATRDLYDRQDRADKAGESTH